MNTATMTAKVSRIDQAEAALTKKAVRLGRTIERITARIEKSTIAIESAEAALKKAHERLEKAKAKAEQVRANGEALIVKQTQERDNAGLSLNTAREKAATIKPKATRKPASGGSVTTEGGTTHQLSKDAASLIKSLLGRKKSGLFAPLDGEDAQAILDAVDCTLDGYSVGDVFEVALKGQKNQITFSVEANGLHWSR